MVSKNSNLVSGALSTCDDFCCLCDYHGLIVWIGTNAPFSNWPVCEMCLRRALEVLAKAKIREADNDA